MSKQVIVIDLGSLLDFNPNIFDKMRVADVGKVKNLVQSFQKTQITQEKFLTELQTLVPKYSRQQLAEKWVAVRGVSAELEQQLRHLEALSSPEDPIHFFWYVDRLQSRSVQNLDNCYYSCNADALNPCHDFVQTLREQYGDVSITVFSCCQNLKSDTLISRLRLPITLPPMSICSNLVETQSQQLSELKNLDCAIVHCLDISDLYSKIEERRQESLFKDFREKTQLIFGEPPTRGRKERASQSSINKQRRENLSTSPTVQRVRG